MGTFVKIFSLFNVAKIWSLRKATLKQELMMIANLGMENAWKLECMDISGRLQIIFGVNHEK